MRTDIIIGMNWGSEGKGSVGQYMAATGRYGASIRTGGPNAGHTIYINPGGVLGKLILRHIPSAVVDPGVQIYLGPGALVDPEVLDEELDNIRHAGLLVGPERPVIVDPAAVIITDEMKRVDAEDVARRGSESTREGIGVARAMRARRLAPVMGRDAWDFPILRRLLEEGTLVVRAVPKDLADHTPVLVESTQGYLLSLTRGEYPHVTSTDITPLAVLNDAGLDYWPAGARVVGVARTYPIRIAGNSGPLPGEISWEELSRITGGYVKPERTSVTKKIRRVARPDPALMERVFSATRPDIVVATFADYLVPEAGLEYAEAAEAAAREHAGNPADFSRALARHARTIVTAHREALKEAISAHFGPVASRIHWVSIGIGGVAPLL